MVFGFGQKKERFLTEEQIEELKNIEINAYIEEARKLIALKGRKRAETQFTEIKEKKGFNI